MNIRKATYISLALLTASTILASANQHSRWLLLNGMAASELSNKLLKQQISTTPNWAIDLVIVSKLNEQTVSFSKHHSKFTYVYSPKKVPTSDKHSWQHLIGPWYLGKIRT